MCNYRQHDNIKIEDVRRMKMKKQKRRKSRMIPGRKIEPTRMIPDRKFNQTRMIPGRKFRVLRGANPS